MQNQSIARVQIDAGGHGYVDGQFNITSSEGSDFTSSFAVDAEGAVVQVMIQSHGREFTTDPSEYDCTTLEPASSRYVRADGCIQIQG